MQPKIPTPLTLDPARYRPTYNSGADRCPTIDYATLAEDLDRFGWPDELVLAVQMCIEEATDDPDSRPLDE